MIQAIELGPIEFHREQRLRFAQGSLRKEWFEHYPQLFDVDDFRRAKNRTRPYYFFEWLGAIVLYHSMGYYSLVTKYQTDARKCAILKKTVSATVLDLLLNRGVAWGRAQGPDLFVYAPDFSDWFFCEMKRTREGSHGRQDGYFGVR
jgi:hypothetical protein